METKESLHDEIHRELGRLCNPDEVLGWLASPQPLLDMRIPARMIATGEGLLVLQALKEAKPRRRAARGPQSEIRS